jgi:hypothetical protein
MLFAPCCAFFDPHREFLGESSLGDMGHFRLIEGFDGYFHSLTDSSILLLFQHIKNYY